MTVLKVVAVVAIPVVALAVWPHTPELTPIVPPVAALAAFGVAMIAVMWAYEGWAYLAFAAGEVRDPARTLPRAFIYGTLGLTLVYGLVNVGYFVALPLSAMSGRAPRVAEKAMTAIAGTGRCISCCRDRLPFDLGCNMAAVLACSRAGYGMASDGMFFQVRRACTPVPGRPTVPSGPRVLVVCAHALGQLRPALHLRDVLCGRVQRARRAGDLPAPQDDAHLARPYRTWGYPVVPLVFVVGSMGLVVNTLLERPVESIAGLLLMAAGLPAYAYWRRKRVRLSALGREVPLDRPAVPAPSAIECFGAGRCGLR